MKRTRSFSSSKHFMIIQVFINQLFLALNSDSYTAPCHVSRNSAYNSLLYPDQPPRTINDYFPSHWYSKHLNSQSVPTISAIHHAIQTIHLAREKSIPLQLAFLWIFV